MDTDVSPGMTGNKQRECSMRPTELELSQLRSRAVRRVHYTAFKNGLARCFHFVTANYSSNILRGSTTKAPIVLQRSRADRSTSWRTPQVNSASCYDKFTVDLQTVCILSKTVKSLVVRHLILATKDHPPVSPRCLYCSETAAGPKG